VESEKISHICIDEKEGKEYNGSLICRTEGRRESEWLAIFVEKKEQQFRK
jgi:hypothetical protein